MILSLVLLLLLTLLLGPLGPLPLQVPLDLGVFWLTLTVLWGGYLAVTDAISP